MRTALSGIYLAVCAVQDLKRRQISIALSVLAGCAAVIMDGGLLLRDPGEVFPYLGGLLPGLLLLVLARISRGAAGTGDGICFLVLGAILGARATWILLMSALILACIGGGACMAVGKAGRKTKLPFLTFAAAAWCVQTACGLAGVVW